MSSDATAHVPLRIRRAAVKDAQALVALSAETFTQTFGHLYKPQDLAAFLDSAYDPGKHAQLLEHPEFAVWLLEAKNGPVGYALAGPCGLPHEGVSPGDRELKRLYILSNYQGLGYGARLMEVFLEWCGEHTAWLGVWSENFGAQRFYSRYGFKKAGDYYFAVGEHRDYEFIMRRPASATA